MDKVPKGAPHITDKSNPKFTDTENTKAVAARNELAKLAYQSEPALLDMCKHLSFINRSFTNNKYKAPLSASGPLRRTLWTALSGRVTSWISGRPTARSSASATA